MKKARSLNSYIFAGLGKVWVWWPERLAVKKRCKVEVNSKFDTLRQAVESFVIAEATCSGPDKYAAYAVMMKAADLKEYLPNEETEKS